MTGDVIDVIVVGAGIAGAVCAYQVARAGHQVVLIERGAAPGEKNLSGGLLYARALEQVFPGFVERAPIERRVARHVVGFLNEDSSVSLDYADARLAEAGNAVTVLRSKLDAWLVDQCEDAGVLVMPGVRVDALLWDGERVAGVRAGEEELRSRVVVAADGVNSFLARDAGIRPAPEPQQLAVGVKSVVGLPRATLEDRFRVRGSEGVAHTFVGDATRGVAGGGFLYTNRDSVSVGVVLRLDDLVRRRLAASDVHDHFLAHPAIAPLLEGGDLLEYGSHLTIEDGPALAAHEHARPGCVIVGDAAGFTLNTGFTLRGMDLAAVSGMAAATAIGVALESGDVTGVAAGYRAEIARSVIGADLATSAQTPGVLANPRLYDGYGRLLAGLLRGIHTVDLTPRRPLRTLARQAAKRSGIGWTTLARDVLAAVRGL